MKKALAIIMLLTVLLLSACNSTEVPQISSREAETQQTEVEKTTTGDKSMTPENVTEAANNSSSQPVDESSKSVDPTTEATVPETKSVQETKSEETKAVADEETVAATEPKTESAKAETKPVEETNPVIPDEAEDKEPEETVPEQMVVVRADPSDVEMLVAQYVNQQRNSEGAASMTVLSELTQVARYRSVQIIQNFAHANSATVCTELKYGEFVDMTQYGMSESDSYYQGYNREALAKGNWGGTAEEIAQKIATGFKNSSSHWKYLSSNEYSYMAVGCTYDEATSMWYCCICVSAKNYGG